MAKSGIDLSLSEGTMSRLGEASKAQAGVGEYASTGFSDFLDTASEYAQGKLDDKQAALDKEAADAEAKSEEGRKAMDKAASEALALGGGLGDNYFDNVYDDIEGLRGRWDEATTDKERAKIMQEMNGYSTEMQTAKESRASMADSWDKGLMSDAMTDESRHVMEQFLSNKTKITKGADGGRIHEVTFPDGRTEQFTSDQISDMQILKSPAHNAMGKLATEASVTGAEGGFFNEEKTRIQVRNTIKKEDLPSLINDTSEATGTSFKEALPTAFDNVKYIDLGKMVPSVDGKELAEPEAGETFWYENISESDKEALVAALTDPKNDFYNAEVTMKALENYHTKFIGQQYQTTLEGTDVSQVSGAEEKGKLSAEQKAAEAIRLKELGIPLPNINEKGLNIG